MTDTSSPPGEQAPRVSSGVPGLDTLLGGGWLRGGTYIITGAPGTGKTLLGNLVRLESRVAVETLPDALVLELFDLVKKHGIKRLVLDGLEPFVQEANDKKRTPRFITALNNTLRGLGVTALATQQTTTLFGPELNAPLEGVDCASWSCARSCTACCRC